ncbi:hypothetical protein FDP41_006156 [Naegleria fowleri]|uniref:Uncharacterized protein n=1 Tax=Naegleria fowleri TaxID=5763 RepID=A0A6A5BIK1_NAEFO|nr:uncharacterized protein FDP41_006156 [Naegleria fowleri]KAF0974682.1 hypothetical protein FDP41_006156 [Naegleria fowleri]CAG4718502.1 unnamed protein product [Naegleria fowleri]
MVNTRKNEDIPDFLINDPKPSKQKSKLTVLVKDPYSATVSNEGTLQEKELSQLQKGVKEVKDIFVGPTKEKEIKQDESQSSSGLLGTVLGFITGSNVKEEEK